MLPKPLAQIVAASAAILFACNVALASDRPIWSRSATPLYSGCSARTKQILSPDRQSYVEITCSKKQDEVPAVVLKTVKGASFAVPVEWGASELLWAPNSKAFFINGGLSSYAGFFISVYEFNSEGLQKKSITDLAQEDMVATYPPCKAWNRDGDVQCLQDAANPQYNMSGIAWTTDSRSISVFAEIPCSSSHGGIMCQVQGYVLRVSDGKILERKSATEVKQQWRKQLAWTVHVPEPPEYGPANVTFPASKQ